MGIHKEGKAECSVTYPFSALETQNILQSTNGKNQFSFRLVIFNNINKRQGKVNNYRIIYGQ